MLIFCNAFFVGVLELISVFCLYPPNLTCTEKKKSTNSDSHSWLLSSGDPAARDAYPICPPVKSSTCPHTPSSQSPSLQADVTNKTPYYPNPLQTWKTNSILSKKEHTQTSKPNYSISFDSVHRQTVVIMHYSWVVSGPFRHCESRQDIRTWRCFNNPAATTAAFDRFLSQSKLYF